MTTRATIVLNPIEPAGLSIRHALGVNLDLQIALQSQVGTPVDPTPLLPQLALMPRSWPSIYAYDLPTIDGPLGTCGAMVPGIALMDPAGFNIEVYFRRVADPATDPPLPTSLAARGVLALQGSAYAAMGPLGMINVPVIAGPPGPPGPAGAPGAPGQPGTPGTRGSIWLTGTGDPTVTVGVLDGDMYLDELNGNVWRYDGGVWLLGHP